MVYYENRIGVIGYAEILSSIVPCKCIEKLLIVLYCYTYFLCVIINKSVKLESNAFL